MQLTRYCRNCKKQYNFDIKDMKELENLICPVCGHKIDKNSRTGNNPSDGEVPAEFVGKAYYFFIRFFFLFFPLCGLIGVIAFFMQLKMLLYVTSCVGILVYIIRYGKSSKQLTWPILGVLLCGIYFRTVDGVCLGIAASFIVRYVYQRIILKIFAILVRAGRH